MNRKTKWSVEDIASQKGRIAVVTGANSGLGYHTARALALKGARVIMACRNLVNAEKSRQLLLNDQPIAEPEVWLLDLSDLTSVKAFSERYSNTFDHLDLLINNAGIMAIPYGKTREGFEMQFGVNHLGHFVLTARLWPVIIKTPGSRVINLSSIAHHMGQIRFEDINWEKRYSRWGAYGMSKLANLLFTKELARRVSLSGASVTSAAAHPGYANTELQTKSAMMRGSKMGAKSFGLANQLFAQPAEMGSLPTLYAATAPGVDQGDFIGPGGFMHMMGWPARDRPNPNRVTDEVARQLWELSESLTRVEFSW